MPLLRLEAVSRDFDVSRPWLNRVLEREPRRILRAVDRVSFEVSKGETLALVGESGCGKSTVARLIARLYSPTEGRIDFRGERLQMIFQDPYASLNPRWRVRDIVAEPLAFLSGYDTAPKRATRVAKLLTQVGLSPDDADKYPHEFSGGQRQRICIARALALQPKVLIADEAVSALDVSVQAQVLALLAELRREMRLAMIFITHDLRIAAEIADRVIVLQNGRIVEEGPTAAVFTHPREAYTRELLDAIPGRRFFDQPGLPRQREALA
jgi:ABC-type glutathione transport system ATPase component